MGVFISILGLGIVIVLIDILDIIMGIGPIVRPGIMDILVPIGCAVLID